MGGGLLRPLNLKQGRTVLAKMFGLVLLCYVESMILGGNVVPQQGQHPIKRINHGCIACKTFSHVTPEVFFRAQVDYHHKQVSHCRQHRVVVKALPRPSFIVVQSQIRFVALKELLYEKAASA